MSISKTILIGNLGQDPEVKYTASGDAVCNFSLATSERWKDKKTNEQKEATEWHRCTAYGRPAEIIGEFARKGSKMYIEGQNKTRKWQDQNGVDRYTTEVRVREFQFLDSRSDTTTQQAEQSHRNSTAQNPTPQQYSVSDAIDNFDDDIPF